MPPNQSASPLNIAFNDLPEDERLKALSEVFNQVMFWCWTLPAEDGETKLRQLKSGQHRFLAFSVLVRPDIFNEMTYEQIGQQEGITKQMMSHIARDFERSFGIKFRRSHKKDNQHAAAARRQHGKED